jgi:hypothetical protein
MSTTEEGQVSRGSGRKAGIRKLVRFNLVAAFLLHVAAFACLILTEADPLGRALFLLTWGLLNFTWLLLLRRPVIAAALSLAIVVIVILVSQFKFDITWMTITFMDVLIIDTDTFAFLLTIFPDLRASLLVIAAVAIPALALLWYCDCFRARMRTSVAGIAVCLVGLVALSNKYPEQPWEPFQGVNHVSNFARSGVLSVSELSTKGWLEFDTAVANPTRSVGTEACAPSSRPPHIIMVLDESSFDITMAPGIKVPPNYTDHFRSYDGKIRRLLTEATGGPTWYTEYNVLTGLSARSFGRLMFYVTRIAAGRVERGLPQALRRCGYNTVSLYPAYGAFLSARRFQKTAGMERMIDSKEMGAGDVEPDRFYYDQAVRLIEKEGKGTPLFIFVYTVANHFPWNTTYRPDLTPDWKPLGNSPEVDEYIRRQTLSARDYSAFAERLRTQFPDQKFLVVRFGDHPPAIAHRIIDPTLDDEEIARRVMNYDPRYYTAYYAVDGINFTPVESPSAHERLDAPYLPLVVQEAAGLPLDSTFQEQKRILQRCDGLFYACKEGAEARRFNRLLMDAGLIKGF